ncbi:hypothetical protein BGZ76_004108 [Entomortierella beljakovae]|nr:hypothetical protein BGZ76_004108 [Entomortierella beljakovae]
MSPKGKISLFCSPHICAKGIDLKSETLSQDEKKHKREYHSDNSVTYEKSGFVIKCSREEVNNWKFKCGACFNSYGPISSIQRHIATDECDELAHIIVGEEKLDIEESYFNLTFKRKKERKEEGKELDDIQYQILHELRLMRHDHKEGQLNLNKFMESMNVLTKDVSTLRDENKDLGNEIQRVDFRLSQLERNHDIGSNPYIRYGGKGKKRAHTPTPSSGQGEIKDYFIIKDPKDDKDDKDDKGI